MGGKSGHSGGLLTDYVIGKGVKAGNSVGARSRSRRVPVRADVGQLMLIRKDQKI